jgi:hypothetical protein
MAAILTRVDLSRFAGKAKDQLSALDVHQTVATAGELRI